jgi:hypothetical protein
MRGCCRGRSWRRDRVLLAAYRVERDWLRPKQRPRGLGWMWTDDYQKHRSRASLLLDLAGYLPQADAARDLTDALAFRDPRLVYFALTSLLQNDAVLRRRPSPPSRPAPSCATTSTKS